MCLVAGGGGADGQDSVSIYLNQRTYDAPLALLTTSRPRTSLRTLDSLSRRSLAHTTHEPKQPCRPATGTFLPAPGSIRASRRSSVTFDGMDRLPASGVSSSSGGEVDGGSEFEVCQFVRGLEDMITHLCFAVLVPRLCRTPTS